jgi:uncharacterized membrane protein
MPTTKTGEDFQKFYPGAAPSNTTNTTGENQVPNEAAPDNFDTPAQTDYSAAPTANK